MNDENNLVWENFIGLLKNRVALVSINSYFKYCKIYKIDDAVQDNKSIKIVTIMTSSQYIKEALIKRYLETIEELMESILGKNCNIEFVLEEEIANEKNIQSNEETPKANIETQIPITEQTTTNSLKPFETNLSNKYTFENFVVGESSNRLAFEGARQVAEQPGRLFNPFFIHGKSGLGKTHLMHAIGNYITAHSNLKVLYVTSERFIQDFRIINMKKDATTIQSFKDKYRDIDVLIIDDIQFLEKAEKTQQEFFHTFNNLYDMNKQIIISSDRSPDDLKLLEERLVTRFSWGLRVNIYPPDVELKKRIIKNKMIGHAVANLVEDEVIEYIANNSENDVRHLEGAITRLYAYAAMMGPHKIDLEFANEALKDYLKSSVYMDSNIAKIQKAVADYYKITVEDLKSKRRTANINYPRQIAIYLCRNYTDESFPKIGLEFGNRDHSTIMYACDKIEADLKVNNQLKEIIKEIKNNIG